MMIDAQNRLQDRENYKVELEVCMKCKRKDRLVNVKLGKAFCNICRGLYMDNGDDAQHTISKFTPEEIRTMTPEEIKIYEYRISDRYLEDFYFSKLD